MMTLPAVLLTIVNPSRMGTPLDIMVDMVRVNFATATFFSRSPKTGDFSTVRSKR